MSDHDLPPDPASWPTDPYQLLGVWPGVSARDLRQAYLRLIRTYKPEHSPEAFQKIRQAYESLQEIARRFDSIENRDDQPIKIARSIESEHRPKWEPESTLNDPPEPWELACLGESERAYQTLLQIRDRGPADEETFLQLYWLLILNPRLEPSRVAADWLIQGLIAGGSNAGRLRELLRRELSADPSLATSERVFVFFKRKSTPELARDVAYSRWRAARNSKQWNLILDDVHSLRNWLPEVDEDLWARLLLDAATNLSWGDTIEAELAAIAFCRQAEALSDRRQDYDEELYQVEFVQIVKAGLDRLGERPDDPLGLRLLLSGSWDERGPGFEKRLRLYSDRLARDPQAALQATDRIQALAPAVLARLSTLLGGLDFDDRRSNTSRDFAELAPVIGRFLSENRWNDYPLIRRPLLRFCLKEAIAPGLMARTLTDRPEFVLTGKSPLAQSIRDDLPLRHVYRAFELSWEEPASNLF